MPDLPSRAAVRYALTQAGFTASERRRMASGTFWSPGFRISLARNEFVRVYVETGNLLTEPGVVHARALRLMMALRNRQYQTRIVARRDYERGGIMVVDYIDVKNSDSD